MFGIKPKGLPKPPPSTFGRTAEQGELTPAGVPWASLMDTLPPEDRISIQPEAQAPGGAPTAPQGLPTPPPSVSRSTKPFSKENLSRTLMDIGSSLLSNQDFFQGLGAAGKAVAGRMDDIADQNIKDRPKVTYGGPNDRFEITSGPNGERSVREVPEFAKVLAADAAAKNAPAVKDVIDQRARAMHAISQLPEDRRQEAYASLMNNPGMYGGLDVNGMPPGYDSNYGQVMAGMGQSVPQALTDDYRNRSLTSRNQQAEARLQQGERRLNKPPAAPRAKATKTTAPAGYNWE